MQTILVDYKEIYKMSIDIENLVNDGFEVAVIKSPSENGYVIKLPDEIGKASELSQKLMFSGSFDKAFGLAYDPTKKEYKVVLLTDTDDAFNYRPSYEPGDALFLNTDANLPEIIRISHDIDFITALKYATNFDVEEVVAEEDKVPGPVSGYLIMVRDKRVQPQRLLGFINADYEKYYGDYVVDEAHIAANPDMASVFLDEDEADVVKRTIKRDFYTLSRVSVSDVRLTVVAY